MTKKVLTIVIDERVEGLEPLGSAVSALEYDGFIVEEYSIHEYGVSIMSKLQKNIEAEEENFKEVHDDYTYGDDIFKDIDYIGDLQFINGLSLALRILKGEEI